MLHVDTTDDVLTVQNELGLPVPLTVDAKHAVLFPHAVDDYTVALPCISSGTANGSDPQSGAAITGCKCWNFTFPTIVDSGTSSIGDFESATEGAVTFGGAVGEFATAGETWATWNDPNTPNSRAAQWAVLLPTTVPLGAAATGYSSGSFAMTVPGGTLAVPIALSTTSGLGTLVYRVDRTGNIVTISPVDITTTAGQTTITTNLVAGTPVKIYGIPQAN